MERESATEGHKRSPNTLTIRDMARVMRVASVQTIRDMVDRGDLPKASFRTGGRPRWFEHDVLDWIERKWSGETTGAAHQSDGEGAGSLAGRLASSQQTPNDAPLPHSADEGGCNAN